MTNTETLKLLADLQFALNRVDDIGGFEGDDANDIFGNALYRLGVDFEDYQEFIETL